MYYPTFQFYQPKKKEGSAVNKKKKYFPRLQNINFLRFCSLVSLFTYFQKRKDIIRQNRLKYFS